MGRTARGNFFMVDNGIFDRGLTLIAFCVYCYLLRCDNRQNGCYPSRRTISKACGISVSSMGRAVKELEEKALVRVYHSFGKGRQHNNSYELLPLGSAPSPLVTER